MVVEAVVVIGCSNGGGCGGGGGGCGCGGGVGVVVVVVVADGWGLIRISITDLTYLVPCKFIKTVAILDFVS
jgi:hypothetical protein